ncbi:MAG: thioredoxin family protein [Robiginitalea sp.]|jgi:thioredoxin-related protein
MRKSHFCILLLGLLHFLTPVRAQDKAIRWLSFEQLEDSLAVAPKKVFVDFYADWCEYCKKMDRVAFRDPQVISNLNEHYYPVRMNAETSDTIIFDGQAYINRDFGKKRNPVHEIPLLLASREGVPFSLPAIVILDESFRILKRYFQYIPPGKMREILQE